MGLNNNNNHDDYDYEDDGRRVIFPRAKIYLRGFIYPRHNDW